MYNDHFGLDEAPFSIAPDPRYLYLSQAHREALGHLIYGVRSDGGLVLLTGEVGTGKTTVCRCLLEQLPEDVDVAMVLNPKLTTVELLATICDEFCIPYDPNMSGVKGYVDRINDYLLTSHAKNRRAVLIIDEAQNLSADVLEQLRLLTNLETSQRKLLQIILLGQPELRDLLRREELRQFSQRITARYHLGPLHRDEINAYVSHRFEVAGLRQQIFTPAAIRRLFRLSHGIPRVINLLCDRALLGAFARGEGQVTRRLLGQAAREVFGTDQLSLWQRCRSLLLWLLGGLALVSAGAAVAAGYLMWQERSTAQHAAILAPAAAPKPAPVVEPVGEPASQPKSTLPSSGSEFSAYQALFARWGLAYQPDSQGMYCRDAALNGLGCLARKGSLRNLQHLNRPAVLVLHPEGGRPVYAALIALGLEEAKLIVGGEAVTLAPEQIEQFWLGDFTLFWRFPPGYKGELKPGDRSPAVTWLGQALASLQGKSLLPEFDLLYDDQMVAEVKRFQVKAGLVPDGIVGPQTLIHLNSLLGGDEPLLTVAAEESR
ncbi:MAG: ExeA family protein [Trichloromonadaceae bacterium]